MHGVMLREYGGCCTFTNLLLTPRKESLMKTQTRIINNRLYYTRKIELQRKGKKSRTVRITPILICGICCSSHLTGKCGTKTFLGGSGRRAVAHTCPAFPKNTYGPVGIPLIRGASGAGRSTQTPEGGNSLGGRSPEAEGNHQVPRNTRPDPCRR